MPRKISRVLKKRADKIWSKIIRSKDRCEAEELGGCKGVLSGCHIIRRANNSLRHDLDNGLSLCVAHHYWFDKGDKFEVTEWFNSMWPMRHARLKKKNKIVHYKKYDWEEIIEDLKAKL